MATVALHPVVERVTARIAGRSRDTRAAYLARMDAARGEGPYRHKLSCGNLAHAFAAAGPDKPALRSGRGGNIGIVTAYNDMLSAHQPMEQYPSLIRMAARNAGGGTRRRSAATSSGAAPSSSHAKKAPLSLRWRSRISLSACRICAVPACRSASGSKSRSSWARCAASTSAKWPRAARAAVVRSVVGSAYNASIAASAPPATRASARCRGATSRHPTSTSARSSRT